MCGGIVGAISLRIAGSAQVPTWHLAYNMGRITSYTLAGALAGGLGYALGNLFPAQRILYVLAQLMLVGMGLYLMGWRALLAPIERIGQRLWRHLQPIGQRFLPVRSAPQAFGLGLIWGWLPCGLVYSACVYAMAAGSSRQGALLLFAFGAGTLPNLLLAGFLFAHFRAWMHTPLVRTLSGGLVLGYGLIGLLRFGQGVTG